MNSTNLIGRRIGVRWVRDRDHRDVVAENVSSVRNTTDILIHNLPSDTSMEWHFYGGFGAFVAYLD